MTINEIAQLAGVSRATVSRYLNNGYVSEEKKEKIREVIERTGYQPSIQAQNLRTKKTQLVGVIIPKLNSESISRMVDGISRILTEAGYQLLLANTNNNEKEELRFLNILKQNQVDGIILFGTIFTAEHKKVLKKMTIPVVVLGQNIRGYSSVYSDNYNAVREMTKLLLKKGKKAGYIGVAEEDIAVGLERKKGFLDACGEMKLSENDIRIVTADFNLDAGYEAAGQLLKEYSEIDTIMCATDSIALGAIRKLREAGKKIPEEIQVAGVGDGSLSFVSYPTLSTVHLFYGGSGKEAATLLLEIMNQPPEQQVRKEIKLGYRVELRGSTR